MKPLNEIIFGFSDAENYRRRENKDLFNKIFLRTDFLDKLTKPNVFFLLGEKGTGKTAYAVYLSNNKQNNNNAIHKYIRETDYQKFMQLKRSNNLSLSDYGSIWKVICFLLLADAIQKQQGTVDFFLKNQKFKALRDAINEYYHNAFSPEIPSALQMIENSQTATDIVAKHFPLEAGIHGKDSSSTTTNKKQFQTNLLVLEKKFEECLSSVKIPENFLLFIDGIDIRPSEIPYSEYLDCVKGLANAVWSMNNDFFPSIRDSKGRMRLVLLIRPDIFNSLGLQNRNTKLKDNSLILDWRTTYSSHRDSSIFKLADRMFSAQQDSPLSVGEAWDHYFPFNASTLGFETKNFTSFIVLLRYSLSRPRDILTILDFLNLLVVQKSTDDAMVFKAEHLLSSNFKRAYGDYLLGEVKDSLAFYYSDDEFETFIKFFEYLDGDNKFDYERYLRSYDEFSRFLNSRGG